MGGNVWKLCNPNGDELYSNRPEPTCRTCKANVSRYDTKRPVCPHCGVGDKWCKYESDLPPAEGWKSISTHRSDAGAKQAYESDVPPELTLPHARGQGRRRLADYGP